MASEPSTPTVVTPGGSKMSREERKIAAIMARFARMEQQQQGGAAQSASQPATPTAPTSRRGSKDVSPVEKQAPASAGVYACLSLLVPSRSSTCFTSHGALNPDPLLSFTHAFMHSPTKARENVRPWGQRQRRRRLHAHRKSDAVGQGSPAWCLYHGQGAGQRYARPGPRPRARCQRRWIRIKPAWCKQRVSDGQAVGHGQDPPRQPFRLDRAP